MGLRMMGRKGLSEEQIKEMQETAKNLQKQHKTLTMMAAIESIVALAEDSQFCPQFFKLADKYLKYLAEKQEISKNQALMLALFVEINSSCNHPDMGDLKRFVNCNGVQTLVYQNDLDELVKRGLLRCSEDRCMGGQSYILPNGLLEAYLKDKEYKRESYAGLKPEKLFKKLFKQTHSRYENELSTELMIDEAERMLNENENLPFVQELRKLSLLPIHEVMVFHFCRTIVINHCDSISIGDFNYLIDDFEERNEMIDELQQKTHPLIMCKILEPAFNDGFEEKSEYRLTDKMRSRLLKGIDYVIDQASDTTITACKDIVKKQLFFDKEVGEQLKRLTDLVDERKYKEICKRLKAKGMRRGFACLFYGAAGTGKTESVLQLARQSGRDIMQVNISDVKSKWVGDSEKNIKAIFDRYRMAVKKSKKVPILLFNEADAIINKRINSDTAVDKMENAIQNIILQEMETMEGILIATTNLEKNMDSAFERRFLFKVKFQKPSAEQRSRIWRNMLPSLEEDTAIYLAKRYDFSGGQIENIARKMNIDSVLYGQDTINREKLEQFCSEETLVKRAPRKRIGFTAYA